ncbi:hypothetical protein Micbo1qcDRAFT_170806 [Microdochium bolleyi]|uniref:Ser-Thr-rich glycosyl-phosphatidyl-inositol-anchored membrane family-domain-containing protein n=1 Tax=Microdochium bolleyi TaxID=196109 RepID=A0A136JIV3_9PEZI|nr:hypothetical protein Micbo1qcDRAFT_170806 [Microdochium bolleyi]
MVRPCLLKLISFLPLVGSALSLRDPVHYGGNVQMFPTPECSPTTTTTTTVTVTISQLAGYAGGQTTETADAVWTTLPQISVTNTTTSTVKPTRTTTAYSAGVASSDCITVTVKSPWSNSTFPHGSGISLTAGVGLPTIIPISGTPGIRTSGSSSAVAFLALLAAAYAFLG